MIRRLKVRNLVLKYENLGSFVPPIKKSHDTQRKILQIKTKSSFASRSATFQRREAMIPLSFSPFSASYGNFIFPMHRLDNIRSLNHPLCPCKPVVTLALP